jgi:GTP:adenosylcobinamide-phosphate guanylyltransferase
LNHVIDAAVMAGGTPEPDEPLFAYTRGRPKALLPVGGKPMVQWVLDAVGATRTIRNVSIVGLDPRATELQCRKPFRYVPGTGSLVENIQAAAAAVRAEVDPPQYLLTIGSDIPAVTPAMIEWATTTPLASGRDAYGFVVSLATLARRFAGPHEDLLRLVEGHVVMGDLALFKPAALAEIHPAWPRLLAARKSVVTMARLAGAGILLRLLFRRLRRTHIERLIRTRLDLDNEILVCPFAEVAMDADRPHEYEILVRDFERHPSRG